MCGEELALCGIAWRKNRMSIGTKTVSYANPVVQELMAEMEVDLSRFYGERHYPSQNLAEWSSPDGTMMMAFHDSQPAGCGGFIRLDDTTAELKRMFVRARYRRRGVARVLLTALEETAREFQYSKVVLETGAPQVEAQELYLAAGYVPMKCWSPHDLDPTSVCFGRELLAGDGTQTRPGP